MGIDKDLPFAFILLMKQVDQFPGGAPVKIARHADMKVSVAFF